MFEILKKKKKKPIFRTFIFYLDNELTTKHLLLRKLAYIGNVLLLFHDRKRNLSELLSERASFIDSDNDQANQPSEIITYYYFLILTKCSLQITGHLFM